MRLTMQAQSTNRLTVDLHVGLAYDSKTQAGRYLAIAFKNFLPYFCSRVVRYTSVGFTASFRICAHGQLVTCDRSLPLHPGNAGTNLSVAISDVTRKFTLGRLKPLPFPLLWNRIWCILVLKSDIWWQQWFSWESTDQILCSLKSKGKLEPIFLSVSSSHKSYNWGDRGGDPSVIHGQSPCQGVASFIDYMLLTDL